MRAKIRMVEGGGVPLELTLLDARCFPGEPGAKWEESYWFEARAAGELVAFAGVAHRSRRVWELTRCGVRPDARGRGLQRALVRARERFARSRGGAACVTYVEPSNFASANNLIACGYRVYAPATPWGVPSALYLTRSL